MLVIRSKLIRRDAVLTIIGGESHRRGNAPRRPAAPDRVRPSCLCYHLGSDTVMVNGFGVTVCRLGRSIGETPTRKRDGGHGYTSEHRLSGRAHGANHRQ
jgi:hypothetical protein